MSVLAASASAIDAETDVIKKSEHSMIGRTGDTVAGADKNRATNTAFVVTQPGRMAFFQRRRDSHADRKSCRHAPGQR